MHLRPPLGTQQPQAHLHQPVPQVQEDDVGPVGGGVVVEGYWPFLGGTWMIKPVISRLPPGARQLRKPEALTAETSRACRRGEIAVMRDLIVTRRVHPVYLYGLPLMMLGQIAVIYTFVNSLPEWLRIAHALLG